MPNPFLYL
ncbi:hypothetical protein CGLO_18208 [Colletotrichum gloeosporioides Cg-14]|uniref:Uncharacterized protein n=1 Tax=Colletotrichum gloeosporioides (strain Cg-14) TaxID=1237896 RepID=T0JRZ4_COLGC|nr:hypothetical protein CGLO_18208 [Colletotrichum gloeosporioides Cg-14]